MSPRATSRELDQAPATEQPRSFAGLRRGLPVYCVDSAAPVGKAEGWLEDPDEGTDLLVRSGLLRRKVRRVRGGDVDWVGRDRVLLSIDRWQFEDLPPYVPDEELEPAVYDALKALGPIRFHALRRVEVQVRRGVVRLRGHVAKDLHRHEAVQVAGAVPGVVRVEDELVSDEQLVTSVAVAMLPYPQLQPSRVTVQANLGTVILEGELDSPRDVELAKELAARVPGVVSVESRLRVRDEKSPPAPSAGWPSGDGGSKLVMLVSAEWPSWRPAGEMVVSRDALAEIVRREVVR